jgi:Co/Zn/Cd efflux system component
LTLQPPESGHAPGLGKSDASVLRVALALNATMFVVGLGAGIIADSLGLVADSLDMLADAGAYGLSLAAIGRPIHFKTRVARISGILLLVLGAGVLTDAIRRSAGGSDPDSGIIIVIALASLVVNAFVIRQLTRFRRGEVHLRAAWLFTRADVVANLGVICAGLIVMVTGSAVPDLIAGVAIGLYVMNEARGILRAT